jgi:hypothetical protein
VHDLRLCHPPRLTHRTPPITPLLRTDFFTWPPIWHAAGTRRAGDLAVRYLVPESADTGPARSDGRGIDLLDAKGVVVIMSLLRRSATEEPRMPHGTSAGATRRGGIRRGAG